MIVVEEPQQTDAHVRKTQFYAQFNAPVATSSTPLIPTESPPAYTPRQDPGPSSSAAPPYHDPPPPPVPPKRQPKPAAMRFFEALLIALGTYAAIVFAVKMVMHMADGPWDDPRRMVGRPEPQDGRIIRCVRGGEDGWSPTSRIQFLSFGIPSDLSAIYVMARGQQATGRVTVVPDQTSVDDGVTIDITAKYHEWETFRGTIMCLMERKKGEQGIGIFTPKHLTWTNRRSEIEVTVKIPRQQATPVIELPRFEVLTPDFQVTLPNADSFVNFRDLTIHASNMPVAVGSVRATNIDIKTSNAGIDGTFITNSSLKLTTSNAPITANIVLENDCPGKETSARAITTSGSLTGTVSLLSKAGAPRYAIHAATTNAQLNLAFLQDSGSPQPSSPILDIVGTTSNGLADLLLRSSFEGTFDVSTSHTDQAGFSSESTPESDPLGLGRQQHIDFTTSTKSRKEGGVYWGDHEDGREVGRAVLSTSNAPASIHIQ